MYLIIKPTPTTCFRQFVHSPVDICSSNVLFFEIQIIRQGKLLFVYVKDNQINSSGNNINLH